MACERLCMEEMDVRSRSEATASKSRLAGLTMYYSGTDDVNKRQCSFAIIATIFISSFNWRDEKSSFQVGHGSISLREISLREIWLFSKLGQFRSEEVTAVMVGDALLALMAKSGRAAYNGPSSTLTLNNPFRESAVGLSTFLLSFIPTPTP